MLLYMDFCHLFYLSDLSMIISIKGETIKEDWSCKAEEGAEEGDGKPLLFLP